MSCHSYIQLTENKQHHWKVRCLHARNFLQNFTYVIKYSPKPLSRSGWFALRQLSVPSEQEAAWAPKENSRIPDKNWTLVIQQQN